VSAKAIERLAEARLWLITGLREAIARWEVAPSCVVLFGSVARKQAGPDSDLDLLVVRPLGIEEVLEEGIELSGSLSVLRDAITSDSG
jgi:predicted nucleotidyltransferase